ncbi:MAG: alpha/beta hydrolase [Proteobacteria bacterium]|nr:alpha/beta hydrolase [Pseudomonadota bacterium]
MKKVIWFCIALMFTISLMSCTRFFILKKEVARLDKSYYLGGKLGHEFQTNMSVWVFVWEKHEDGVIDITEAEKLDANKTFVIMLPPGERYYVGALEDANNNEEYDPGERIWFNGEPSPVEFRNGRSNTLIIRLSGKIKPTKEDIRAFARARKGRSYIELKGSGQVPIFIGKQAELNDPIFSAQMGEKGLWEPASFLNEIGLGVYFLSEYDPDKIPVLFVHGAGGSPQDWKHILKGFDDHKYQKWFYHYPGGIRLNQTADALNIIIETLYKKYRFKELYIVAHSMGGLVSRSFIIKNRIEAGNSYITKFVSIATPWAGHEAAALGVKRAPAVIPSWIDMQLNSQFINELMEQKIEDKLDYYLLFTFKGAKSAFLPASNDGTVSLASQLTPKAQQEAKRLFGFNCNHTSVLHNDDVITTLKSIMKNP